MGLFVLLGCGWSGWIEARGGLGVIRRGYRLGKMIYYWDLFVRAVGLTLIFARFVCL